MSADLTFADDEAVELFVRKFQSRTLPKSEWTHHAHLAIGLWHVLNYPLGDALPLLREGIRGYNESIGIVNTPDSGYHETLTVFFLHAIAAYESSRRNRGARLSLFNELPASRLSSKLLPLAFYSRDLIMSPTARLQIVEPDVQPLTVLSAWFSSSSMSPPPFYLRRAGRPDFDSLIQLIIALADFEKLPPPDADARQRLIEDAFGSKPRFEAWLAIADGHNAPVGYAIFLETYSSFLALPTLYIEDIFVLPEYRRQGIGGALLRKAVELGHQRGCGRIEWIALDWNVNAQQVYEQRMGAKRMSEWLLYRMTHDDIARFMTESSPRE